MTMMMTMISWATKRLCLLWLSGSCWPGLGRELCRWPCKCLYILWHWFRTYGMLDCIYLLLRIDGIYRIQFPQSDPTNSK